MNFQGGNGLRFSCITALHSELLAVSTTGYLYQVGKTTGAKTGIRKYNFSVVLDRSGTTAK